MLRDRDLSLLPGYRLAQSKGVGDCLLNRKISEEMVFLLDK